MLPGATEDEIAAVAEKLRESVLDLNITHEFSKAGNTVSISLGGAILVPDDSIPHRMLIERADQALYQSKENGRNRYTLFTNGKPQD